MIRKKITKPSKNLAGSFLLSTNGDTNAGFGASVILIIFHDEKGALGIIVNKATDKTLGDIAPPFSEKAFSNLPIYLGGPVQPDFLCGIHSGLPAEMNSSNAVVPIPNVTFEPDFPMLLYYLQNKWESVPVEQREAVHLYIGYAGWGANQLENEIKEGLWVTRPAAAKYVFPFSPITPRRIWHLAMQEMGGIQEVIAITGFMPSKN